MNADDTANDFHSIEQEITGTDGDPKKAFQGLRGYLSYPGKLEEKEWVLALKLFARVSEKIAGPEWAAHVVRAAENPRNVQALYDLGYQLMEQQLSDLAATVLARANDIEPGNPSIISELCAALENLQAFEDSDRVLQRHPELLARDSLLQYLAGFHRLMLRDVEGARSWIAKAAGSSDERLRGPVEQVRGMLARADGLRGVSPLDESDLRGWQFVTSGTVLLEISPYGFEEGMRGRYAFFQDSPANCKEGILRLKLLFESWSKMPEWVWQLPNRESAILGLAAAELLGCPLRPLPSGGADGPGLIVAYDLAECDADELKVIYAHQPGQMVWSQATCWTQAGPFAADVTTLLYQVNLSPWSAGRMQVDPATQEMKHSEAATDAADVLAAGIVEANAEPIGDAEAIRKFGAAVARLSPDVGGGPFRSSGNRRRQRVPSPVKSNRFK